MKKPKISKYPGYHVVPETTGKITDAVYISDDGAALIIDFAWGKTLHFKPLEETNENWKSNSR